MSSLLFLGKHGCAGHCRVGWAVVWASEGDEWMAGLVDGDDAPWLPPPWLCSRNSSPAWKILSMVRFKAMTCVLGSLFGK